MPGASPDDKPGEIAANLLNEKHPAPFGNFWARLYSENKLPV
jgi:hypothetical protein